MVTSLIGLWTPILKICAFGQTNNGYDISLKTHREKYGHQPESGQRHRSDAHILPYGLFIYIYIYIVYIHFDFTKLTRQDF